MLTRRLAPACIPSLPPGIVPGGLNKEPPTAAIFPNGAH